MLVLLGDYGTKMKNLSFSLLIALIVFGSCRKEAEQPKNRSVYVISRTSSQPLPSVEMHLNGQFHSYTSADGKTEEVSLFSTDSLYPVDDAFQYTLISQVEVGSTLNSTYWATKKATLEDSLAVAFLKDLQNTQGLLPTIPYGNLVSTYDQALAAIAFILADEIQCAERIFDYFESIRVTELENGPGGFFQFRSPLGVPSGRRWMGDNAWLLIALKNHPQSDKYTALIASLEYWLMGLNDTVDNGLWGGFEPNGDTIHKITEGNIDAFAALEGYTSIHQSILKHLEAEKWDDADGNFVAWPTNPPYKFALDCNTWGYCAFPNFNDAARSSISRYEVNVTSTETGEQIDGYCFDEDQDVLWFEGTGQVSVMHWVAGDRVEAEAVLGELRKGWLTGPVGKGLPYTANQGTTYGAGNLWTTANTEPCVSSTAWYLMASFRHNALFLGRNKQVPVEDQFWAQ